MGIHQPNILYEDNFLQFSSYKDGSVLLTALQDYIPAESFKLSFENIGKEIKRLDCNTLIFDKRNLEVFHQPSMEWYYVYWKIEMLKYGIVKYLKLLPNFPWFNKDLVYSYHKNIIEKNSLKDLEKITIKYLNSMNEVDLELDS